MIGSCCPGYGAGRRGWKRKRLEIGEWRVQAIHIQSQIPNLQYLAQRSGADRPLEDHRQFAPQFAAADAADALRAWLDSAAGFAAGLDVARPDRATLFAAH